MTHRANLLTSYSRTGEEATDWHPSVQRLEPPHIVMETLVLGWQSYPPVLYSHRPIYNRLVARHHPPDSIRTGQNSEVFTRHRIMVSESQIISPFLSLPVNISRCWTPAANRSCPLMLIHGHDIGRNRVKWVKVFPGCLGTYLRAREGRNLAG